ncbi:MAG: aminotransferase class V-fold PLP-dependent enzyme [Methanomicrobiales archaeon]|nr:aminotransferase class V-fold PLP-dependent enzyme [Methanomicrobiales archaeon]
MREPPVKKVLYWCDQCNVPLLGRNCTCGATGRAIPLTEPYDVRPALCADRDLIQHLLQERYGPIPLPKVILLNKAGGIDRTDLMIAHGERWGYLIFDPVTRKSRFDIVPEALPYIVPFASKGRIDLETAVPDVGALTKGRIGGKRFRIKGNVPEGTVILQFRGQYGTGTVHDGHLRVRRILHVSPVQKPDPSWDDVVNRNRVHLKNLERHAIRAIRQHVSDRPVANVSFSGGKDSMAVLTLAKKAGVHRAFFIDTGVEFPETLEYVKKQGVEIVPKGGDFWTAVEKAGPPGKDHRWCCKLLKLQPLKRYLAGTGSAVTIQGNRWYESWNRADLDITSENPANPLQRNISPIRNWRALEVYLYLWWQHIDPNPLYDQGIERIGCYVCPSMMESEYEEVRDMHPELAARWDAFLERWAMEQGLPREYASWGLWRWKELPPKMQELCRNQGLTLPEETPPRAIRQTPPQTQERNMSVDEIRKDFPILGDLIYLDNAATSLSPEPVLQAILDYEHNYRANVGRGVHRLAQIASQRYWYAHQKVGAFIGARTGEIVFTRNSTEAINMVASGLRWKRGDRVVTSILEHHSNLLPWMRLREQGVECILIGIRPDYSLDIDALERALTENTRLVALTHASNVLGVVTPVEEIARRCHDRGIPLLIDGAQSVPHLPVDVSRMGCDYLCFSGHKMLGTTGTGVLWMKEPNLEPLLVGGGSVETVTAEGYTLVEGYQRYEAGTPNIAGGIGLSAAVDYLEKIGMDKVRDHEQKLTDRLVDGFAHIAGVSVYTPKPTIPRIGVVSFTVEGFEPHEVAHFLGEQAEIMVRSGHHCCMPLMDHLGLEKGTVRASLHLYNNESDVDTLLATVGELARGAS